MANRTQPNKMESGLRARISKHLQDAICNNGEVMEPRDLQALNNDLDDLLALEPFFKDEEEDTINRLVNDMYDAWNLQRDTGVDSEHFDIYVNGQRHDFKMSANTIGALSTFIESMCVNNGYAIPGRML